MHVMMSQVINTRLAVALALSKIGRDRGSICRRSSGALSPFTPRGGDAATVTVTLCDWSLTGLCGVVVTRTWIDAGRYTNIIGLGPGPGP